MTILKPWAGAAALAAIVSIHAGPSAAAGVDAGTLFETEGNAVDGPAGGVNDWQNIFAGTDGSLADTGIITDDDEADDIFTGGGSKDDLDLPNWSWKFAKPTPDKDNITDAYAASYDGAGDLVVYFGADRFANNGAADIGFWFFQAQIERGDDGKFIGSHRDGDILVLANFTRGGAVSSVEVYEWITGGGTDGNINLKKITGLAAGECGDAVADKDVCAISNHSAQTSPWPYTPKSGAAGSFPLNSFFEGGINLTQIFGDDMPCFASFLTETRSSTSVDATLKDFALNSFPNCSVAISASCTAGTVNADQTGYDYTYDTTVENGGFATLFNLDVYRIIGQDDHLHPTDTDADEFLGTITSLGAQADQTLADLAFSSDLNPDSVATRVEARTSSSASALPNVFGQVAVPGEECPEAPLSPAINVDKNCETALEVVEDRVVVRVDFSGTVCNTGTAILTGVSATDDEGVPNRATPVALTINGTTATSVTIGKGKCATYSGSYFPEDAGTDTPGSAVFVDTVSASGTGALDSGTATDSGSATCTLCPGADELCEP